MRVPRPLARMFHQWHWMMGWWRAMQSAHGRASQGPGALGERGCEMHSSDGCSNTASPAPQIGFNVEMAVGRASTSSCKHNGVDLVKRPG